MRSMLVSCLRRAGRTTAGMALAGMAMLLVIVPAQAELDIVEVKSQKGVTAWLVEDQSDPTVAISFAFGGGSEQEPEGKEGMADLLVSLLDEGAGELDSDAFQQRFYETGAQLSFRAGSDRITGSLRMLAGETDEALELLALAIQEPRFDEEAMERMRSVLLTRIRAESNDPDEQGEKALAAALYGDHPLGRRATVESMSGISRDDLVAFHGRLFARSNLYIGVVGAIDAATLGRILDEVFGNLPAEANLMDVPPPDLALGEEVLQPYERPQSSISLVYPGIAARDDDIYAASLVTEILGGGGLESRLFTELREKRGLTYGAAAYLDSGLDWGRLVIGVATRGDRTEQALQAARDVVRGMAEEGPSPEELEDAKKYLIGSYAVEQLSSTSSIANTLVGLQRVGRGRDYLERRDELFNAVTPEAAREMARRLLSVEPTLLIVGPTMADGG